VRESREAWDRRAEESARGTGGLHEARTAAEAAALAR